MSGPAVLVAPKVLMVVSVVGARALRVVIRMPRMSCTKNALLTEAYGLHLSTLCALKIETCALL